VTRVTIYGKPDCCLCDDARWVIDDARREREFELCVVDVSLDPLLDRAYGTRVPVIAIDDVELFQYRVDPSALRAQLDRVRA